MTTLKDKKGYNYTGYAIYYSEDVKEHIIDFIKWCEYNQYYYDVNQELETYFYDKYGLQINNDYYELGVEKILGEFEK